jgi:hypothetical protein
MQKGGGTEDDTILSIRDLRHILRARYLRHPWQMCIEVFRNNRGDMKDDRLKSEDGKSGKEYFRHKQLSGSAIFAQGRQQGDP